MGKIEVEDLTVDGLSDSQRKLNIMSLANGLVQSAGHTAAMLRLTFKNATLALHTAAKIMTMIGEKVGKISPDDLSEMKELSDLYASERQKELEESGVMGVIEAAKNIGRQMQEEDDE